MSPAGPRASWHRPAGLVPIAYLAAIVAVGLAHPVVPYPAWLLIHLLLLGAATNAIVVWSAHFAAAILRTPPAPTRHAEAGRLIGLNAGVLAVLAGGVVGPAWLGVAGAAVVFAAIAAHLWVLARNLRRALPARFTIVVRYYLAAGMALLVGIPAGAWMLVVDDAARPRILLFHAHVNLLGWITLTVLGTLLTLWPTVLRTQIVDGATRAATRALPLAVAGLAVLAVGLLAWWPWLGAAGLGLFGAAVAVAALPAVATARNRPPSSFAAWSIAAALGWLVVALTWDAVLLVTASGAAAAAEDFETLLVPLGAGFVGQVLIGSLSWLLPMVLGGGPGPVRARLARFDAHRGQRVAMANAALAVYLLPVPPYVRIATSVLVLVALVQFLIAAVRALMVRSEAATENVHTGQLPAGVGLILVLVAVVGGLLVPDRPAASGAAAVPATGHTTTVSVTATGMRYQPDHIMVPAGDRLVIVLTNADERRHDLVLATGPRTALLAQGASERLDAGLIGATVAGWCSQPMHRQSGMTLTIMPTGAPTSTPTSTVDAMRDPGPAFVARDATLAPAVAATTHRLTLRAQEVHSQIAPGVDRTLWTFNGTAPGPVLRGRIGDVFEITLINEASVEHGIDFHAEALAPDKAMRTVEPGQSIVYRFTATRAGVWMYHCSAMPMLSHIANGMYGAVVIDPPDLAQVDHEYVLVQSEFYPPGNPTDVPEAVAFNGFVSQYTYRPLAARAGERIRIWVLDAGPNRSAAFHLVGAPFDTVYVEGAYRLRPTDPGGAQVLDLAPASGGFVEAVLPQPGTYPFLTHAMVDADRGARGAIQVAP